MTVRSLIRVWHITEFLIIYFIQLVTGQGFMLAGICTLVTMIAIRTVVIGGTCLYVAYTEREHRMTLRSLARYCVTEIYSFSILYFWYQLIDHAEKKESPEVGQKHAILLHGYMCNNGFWNVLQKQLVESGVTASFVEFSAPFNSIDEYVSKIRREVERVKYLNEQAEIYLVSFSMGGLAARKFLSESPNFNIRHFSINTPHQGTYLASISYWLTRAKNCYQMMPNSLWLDQLVKSERGIETVSFAIRSLHDSIVIPADLGCLDVPTYELSSRGHMTAAFDRGVHELICNKIKDSSLSFS